MHAWDAPLDGYMPHQYFTLHCHLASQLMLIWKLYNSLFHHKYHLQYLHADVQGSVYVLCSMLPCNLNVPLTILYNCIAIHTMSLEFLRKIH